jgi:hypothetical protein
MRCYAGTAAVDKESYRFLAFVFLRGVFQYGLLQFGQNFGSPSPLGGHSCPQRSHCQYQTIFFTLGISQAY